MQELFKKFLEKYNGMQGVGNTPDNKSQCTGLCNIWIVDWLKKSFIWGNAKDWVKNYNPLDFDFILNTPDYVPQVGDIIVWSVNYNGNYGHVSLATGTGDLNTFEVFTQNDPLGSNCHLKTYKYTSVVGGLRTRGNATDSQSIILAQSDAFIAVCTKLNLPANRAVVLGELEKLIRYEDDVIEKDKQLSAAQAKITELEKENTEKEEELQVIREQVRALSDSVEIAVEENKMQAQTIEKLKKDCQQTPVFTGWRAWIYDLIMR